MNKTLQAIISVAVLALLGVGVWWGMKEKNNNAALQTNTNTNQVANSNDSVRGRYSNDGVTFDYPSNLTVRPNYPSQLISANGDQVLQDIKVSRLTQNFLELNNGVDKYVDNFVIEFPGKFSVKQAVMTSEVGRMSVTRKTYEYSGSFESNSLALEEAVVVITRDGRNLLLEISGLNNNDFDVAVDTLLQSLQF